MIQEQGAVRDLEAEFRKKSGEVRVVLISSEAIDLVGEPCLISVVKDVTERVRAEEEVRRLNEELEQRIAERTAKLRESEAKMRAQYKGIPVPTYTWQRVGEDFVLVDYNDAAVAITQGKIVDYLGQTASEMYGNSPQILEEFERCFTEQVPIEREMPYRYRSTEESKHLAVKYAFVPPDLVLVHTEDITERVRAREEIERRSAQLEAANRELADFAHIVSHDLKAPLRAISQLADWISEDYAEYLDEEGLHKLRLLIDRAQRMHRLIDAVLEYSRIGRGAEVRRKVDLNQLIGETVEMLGPPEHIQVIVEDQLPAVVGERTRLAQVFQNLLSNAIKFMDKPDGRVSVGCVNEGNHWVFSVADNGPGIEERHFARIWRMFQALSSRDEVESTGVGLAVVKKIVETWDGRVWVESTVGQGSTFYFTHPKKGKTHAKR